MLIKRINKLFAENEKLTQQRLNIEQQKVSNAVARANQINASNQSRIAASQNAQRRSLNALNIQQMKNQNTRNKIENQSRENRLNRIFKLRTAEKSKGLLTKTQTPNAPSAHKIVTPMKH